MSSIYGNAFLHTYGDTDSGVWYDVLNGLTEEQLQHGYHQILELKVKPLEFPPNPLRFKEICLEYKAQVPEVKNNVLREFNSQNSSERVASLVGYLRKDNTEHIFTFVGVINGSELRKVLTPQEICQAYEIFKEYAKIPMWLFCQYVTYCHGSNGDINSFCVKNSIDIYCYS